MERNRRLKYGLPLAFAAAALSFLLTGCLKKPEGGVLTGQGMDAIQKQDLRGAEELFQEAIAAGEDEVTAYRGLGIAYMGQARYREAAQAFETALSCCDSKMPKTRADIQLYLASAHYRNGDYASVITVCGQLSEESPCAEASFYLGGAYLNMDEVSRAREYFDEAVSMQPKDYSLYLQIYEAFEEKNLTAVGDEYLQTALKIQPEDSEGYYRIGQIYYYLEKYEDARRVLVNPVEEKYLPAMELMGEIYLALEDYPHALAVYQNLMQEQGENTFVYNGLAMCCIASGDYDQALSYIETGLALEGDEGKQQLRFNEVVVYEKKLDFATALIKAEAYAELYPTDEAGVRELQFLNTRGK